MEFQPFYVGQRVVSVKPHSQNLVVLNNEYTVVDIQRGCRHAPWLVKVSEVNVSDMCECYECGDITDGGTYFCSSLFAPIEEQFMAVTFEKVLKEELVSMN